MPHEVRAPRSVDQWQAFGRGYPRPRPLPDDPTTGYSPGAVGEGRAE
jgi:hypothetical protein